MERRKLSPEEALMFEERYLREMANRFGYQMEAERARRAERVRQIRRMVRDAASKTPENSG